MRTILLVDDDKDIRKKYADYLKSKEFDVIEAPEALEVVNVLLRDKSRLDLILLDLQIPEIDGRDIYDIVSEHAPSIPIIVSSVLPVNDQKLKVPRATDYFNKAENDEVLLGKINHVLGLN